MNTSPPVGFIGTGLMGQAMATQLINAGVPLCVHSRTASKAEPLIAIGASYAQSALELATKIKAGIIIICVTDSPALEQVITGPEGLLNGIEPDCLIIDMGTSRFDLTQTLALQVKAKSAHYIDAPVSGGQIGAQQGSLSIMAGGHPTQIERAQPLFDIMGQKTTHVGDIGCGQLAKTANQMIVGATLNIVAEALCLAQQNGANPAKVRDALSGGFADSKILQIHGQRMIEQNYTPGARATTQLKDLQQAHLLAAQSELQLPLNQTCLNQWQGMVDAGLGNLDQAGILAWVERNN
ncbi:MAG: NAD(P)-dependent oxidoreductase [Gammaproteobacteria bacterium]|nr:NAD(P)-dependent oxidoreductase [Gammaproteobacteria bacterium]